MTCPNIFPPKLISIVAPNQSNLIDHWNKPAAPQQFEIMEKIVSLQNLVHPLHTNLTGTTNRPMHIIGQLVNDPWYTNHEFRLRNGSHHDGEPIMAPDFDVRESDGYYFLEGEFAGIASKDDLNIEWVGRRMLLIEATVNKVNEEAEWGIHLPSSSRTIEIEEAVARDSGELERKHHKEKRMRGKALRVWMNERHTGVLQKSFTFPCDVNADQMRARLTNGLVKILIPKFKAEKIEPSKQICVEE
jgi:HSP20 family molecular chaperone IbpA